MSKFQSHVGSISTFRALSSTCQQRRFNPTLVRLARRKKCLYCLGQIGFNPTLVRLAQGQEAKQCLKRQSFQSHVGSISTIVATRHRLT